MTEEQVVLVDEQDVELGTMPKLEAHKRGLLHRAISVFVFNSSGEFLLQQRAFNKYHSSGLWSNTCCSHPRPGEDVASAASRRLQEEMGISCDLTEIFSFVYRADVADGLVEHEYDHVFAGITDALPVPDKAEAAGWRYLNTDALLAEIANYPNRFTEWFRICVSNYAIDLQGFKTNTL